ncbi:helix-turn-helix domain-containing protein [Leucobacter sp. W1038]|uniref:AraC-like ligand-binding domain-containing protein n=1 Tax=Leucobacter sp. W1038 TaxID=3438281 RepID=UPI003D99AE6D
MTKSLDEYSRLVRNSVMPLEVSSAQRKHFSGIMRIAGRGRVYCFEVTAPEHTIQRTPQLIEESVGNGFLKLSLMLTGESIVMQDSREAVLRKGDLAIYDTSRPYSLLSSEGARTAIIMFPRELLSLTSEATSQLTAVRFDRERGFAASVSPFMTHLMSQLDQLARPSGSRLPYNIVDLVGTMLSFELEDRSDYGSNSALLRGIMNYIEENLGNPELCLKAIANAHFISPRYLQVLFQRNDLTVSAWVRERRLERCRRDLEDPNKQNEPLASLAARWGFTEPTHFSRAFKRAYGYSPRDARGMLR